MTGTKFNTERDSSGLKFSKGAEAVTSLHGISHIVNINHHCCKRSIWLLLFTICGSLFIGQMALSIHDFLSWPVSVNVKINYNQSIVFPAVTLCNNNAFRLTAAYDQGYYNTITEFYSREGQNGSLNQKQLAGIGLNTLYLQTGHRKEDFIVSCTWEGSSCMDALEPTFTDFGLCYTFNGQSDTSVRRTYTSGTGGGVSLQLNIEQYEYMAGPNEGAGVKLLIHNKGDLPLVKDNGLALQPGTLSFVAIKIIEINSLPPKHGLCSDSMELKYINHYSIQNCYIDCRQRFVVQQCGCRDIYMPSKNSYPPVCSLAEIQECLIPSSEIFKQERNTLCHCPPPCRQMAYESVSSSAGISNFDISKFLQQTKITQKLQEKYRKARAISTKVDEIIIQQDRHFLSTTKATIYRYNTSLQELGTILRDLPKNVSNHILHLRERFDFHFHKCVDRQEFNLHNAYVRYFLESETFFFKPLLIDYKGIKHLIEMTLKEAEAIVTNTKQMRGLVFWPIKEMLIDRKKLAEKAKKEVAKITHNYKIGKKLTGIPISYGWAFDLVYQEPGLTSGDALGQNRLDKHQPVIDALTNIRDNVNLFIKFGNLFERKNQKMWDIFNAANDGYVTAIEAYSSALHTFEHEVVRHPYNFIQNEVFNSHILNTTIDQEETRILQKMNKNLKQFTILVQKHWHNILEIFTFCDLYEREKISKSHLAELVTSESILNALQGLQFSIGDIKKAIEDAKQELRSLKVVSDSVWEYILVSPFYKNLYEKLYNHTQVFLANDSYTEKLVMQLAWFVNYKYDRYILANQTLEGKISKEEMVAMISNADVHTLTIEGVRKQVDDRIEVLSLAIDKALTIINNYQRIQTSVMQFIEYMGEFLVNNNVDSDFYKENFLDVDIYMQELRYEENTAHKAYGIIGLLSDIGGAMGFFIGGSAMSIAEVADVLMNYWLNTFYLR